MRSQITEFIKQSGRLEKAATELSHLVGDMDGWTIKALWEMLPCLDLPDTQKDMEGLLLHRAEELAYQERLEHYSPDEKRFKLKRGKSLTEWQKEKGV